MRAWVKQGVRRSERHAIIAADVGGQAALAKKPFKHSKGRFLWWRKEPHSQEENGWHGR